MKIIFLGTPEFAVPALEKLIESKHQVVGVVTQPDKPVGRSKKPVFSPVKLLALQHNIPVYQFEKIRRDGVEPLKLLNADIMVTCAYGQILSKEVLELTPMGVFNIHGSLLPKYRGASPIQWAIINGEKITGVTILKSDVGIDDGKTILSKSVEINPEETAGELFERLSKVGAECIIQALEMLENKTAIFSEQDNEKATICKMFKHDFGKIDFNKSATEIVNFVRGLNPSPVAYFILNNLKYKVFKCEAKSYEDIKDYNLNIDEFINGEIVLSRAKVGLYIKCENGLISIKEIQAENGKKLDIKSFLNGNKVPEKSVVENE